MNDDEPVKTWRFDLPNVDGEGWAIVFMDSRGCFSALSDWGDVSYRWRSNPNLPAFVKSCNDDQLISKFGQNRREYDPQGTVEGVRDYLWEEALAVFESCALEDGTTRSFTADEHEQLDCLSEEWELLRFYDDLANEHEFTQWYTETDLDDAGEFYTQRYERDVTNFVAKVMPRLRPLLADAVPLV
jgi:hypothetical protein